MTHSIKWFIALGCIASSPVLASTVLSSSHLAVGIHPDGSLVTSDRSLGMVYDPEGNGDGVPMGTDIILPGNPYETWALSWDGDETMISGGPHLSGGATLSWDDVEDTGFVAGVSAQGTIGPIDVEMRYDVPWDIDVMWIEVTLTANSAVKDLWISRSIDADPDYAFNSYSSINTSEENVAVSEAEYAGKAVALAISDGVGAVCNWCSDTKVIYDAAHSSQTRDYVIGVAQNIGDLSAGETTTIWMVYAFGLDTEEAQELAQRAVGEPDRDGDGITEEEGDCDDRDPWTSPDELELPDGLDNDCDGETDEDTVLSDDDNDGFTETEGDCDDADERVFPGAEPIEGISDANCDGEDDEGDWTRTDEPPDGWGEGDDGIVDVEINAGGCHTASALIGSNLLWIPFFLLARRQRGGQ